MRIAAITAENFKKFHNLKVRGIPETAKLVVLVGPNGCGKTSLFEAMNVWRKVRSHSGLHWMPDFHIKDQSLEKVAAHEIVAITTHGAEPSNFKKSIYIRSAYRNDPQLSLKGLDRMGSVLEEERFQLTIHNDQTVSRNYQRLASYALEDVFENEKGDSTIADFRRKIIGEIKDATERLFDGLSMNSLGSPLTQGTFRFDKGTSSAFSYENLSGGEKAAFDLILDLIVKRREYDDTVFCIDEPELHMNTRLQGSLLKELFNLIGPNSQLWISTHSIGMMRAARDIGSERPGEVAFLDFGGKDFDAEQIIEPAEPNRKFWQSAFSVALDDISSLVAPENIFICEGTRPGETGRSAGLDAEIYQRIFEKEFPDVQFISAGNSHDVENDRIALVAALKAVVSGSRVNRLIDRDEMNDFELAQARSSGMKVLSMRNLESYLLADEILKGLYQKHSKEHDAILKLKKVFLEASVERGHPNDDLKCISGQLMIEIRKDLKLKQAGRTFKNFALQILAPEMTPDTRTYASLKKDVFG